MATYVSQELTHFVGRGRTPEEQYSTLVKILQEGRLTHPHSQPGSTGGNLWVSPTGRISDGQLYRTEVVCFCDIPVQSRRIHMNKYSEFGISFSKRFLVSKGASPVFYVASTSIVKDVSGSPVPRAEYFNDKLTAYLKLDRALSNAGLANLWGHVQHLLDFHVFSFIKFFDPSADQGDEQNFYMEREWRVYGNVDFHLSDVVRITVPDAYVNKLKIDVPGYGGTVTPVKKRSHE